MNRMDKLRNLLVMAAADKRLTDREAQYLMSRCEKWDISDALFADAIQYAFSPDAALVLPPGHAERIEMLQDLIKMMAADGKLAEIERDLFAVAAARMEISEEQLNRLIDDLTQRK